MAKQQYDFGMVGLGTMGRNLVLNMSDHGFSVAGYDKDPAKAQALSEGAATQILFGTSNLEQFVAALQTPRAILFLVPAGPVVDSVIAELRPLLSPGDLLIDCGNSHFTDTDRRSAELESAGLLYMGIGVSGGESGARHGPSIMAGGNKAAYARVAPMLEAISAKVDGDPCVAWLGHRSAGNYVKMVHNGIEYGIMQLISETYHLLKEAGGLDNDELHSLFSAWNSGPLQSFLVGITADIFEQPDEFSPNRLIDMIRASAKQKGTGMWTSQNAMDLHIPIPTIDMAVVQRDLSGMSVERSAAEPLYTAHRIASPGDKKIWLGQVEQAFHFATIITYTQGLSLLHHASEAYGYELDKATVARIWRGGCIIRAALLENIRTAFAGQSELSNLMLDAKFAETLKGLEPGIRSTVKIAVDSGIPIPAYMASLAYFDAFRREWLPANLIQAQRDYFGAHTYQRTDREGTFHTSWKHETE